MACGAFEERDDRELRVVGGRYARSISGATIAHTFTTAGAHEATVTVTDSFGTLASKSVEIDVCGALGAACNQFRTLCCAGSTCDVAGMCQ